MRELTVSEARARLADVVDEARIGREPVYLTRRGRRVAAVVDAACLDWLIAIAETGEPAVPWEQVKADLGLA